MSLSIVVRIAFANNVMDLTPTWTDVSTDVISLSVRRGRQHELNRIEAGTARITLLNTSGNYWPKNVTGDYYDNIKPLKRVNIRAVYGGVTYDIYTGFVESWQPDFIMAPIIAPVMVINCVDIQKCLSNLIITDTFAQELSGVRVGRIINSWLGWPVGLCAFDAGISNMQAQTITEANAMAYLYTIQDSEQGLIFQRGTGLIAFQDRYHRITYTKAINSQATFGDDIPPGGTDLGYTAIYTGLDDLFVYNDIHVTRIGGTTQITTDSTSISKYGTRSYAKTNQLNISDGECLDEANYLKGKFKEPVPRVRSITANAGSEPDTMYPILLALDISYRITVRLQQASILQDYFIESISHDWTQAKPGEWITTYQLSGVSNQTYWSLGDTGFSELGETTVLCY